MVVVGGRKRGQKTGRGLWATSLVRPRLLWTSSLPASRGEQRAEVRVRLGDGEQRAGTCGGARTRRERRLVFWKPALQRQHLCQILRSRQKLSERAANELTSTDALGSDVTLEPSDLSGGAVALLVAGGDAEDDGWLGGVVDVCVGQAGRLHQARRVGAAVNPHEGQLGRRGGLGFGRLVALDGQIHRVLDDLPRRHGRRLPGQMGPI